MEYDIDTFTERLMTFLRDNVPFENPDLSRSKHPNRNGKQLRDLFDYQNDTIVKNINSRTFDIGSPMAEALMPHYHILQNSEVIRKKGRATETTRGSQGKISNLLERDYEKVSFNGKTFSKEYSKNVRGQRSKASKILEPKLRYSGHYYEDRRGVSGSYVNVHYKYIDRILDATLPYLAQEFGLRAMRKVDTGLKEEYSMQQNEYLDELFGELLDISSIYETFDE